MYEHLIIGIPTNLNIFIRWSGANLGCCLVLAVRANKYDFALNVLAKLNQEYVGAPPSIDAMKIFLQRAIHEKDFNAAVVRCL
jgi:hypothetical protein